MVGGCRVQRAQPRPRLPPQRDPRTGPRRASMKELRGRISAYVATHRSTSLLVGWALLGAGLPLIVLVPPLSTFQQQTLWLGCVANAGVCILLALGLNIVVGLAGLLDLGYAAFFAIGSYAYAF